MKLVVGDRVGIYVGTFLIVMSLILVCHAYWSHCFYSIQIY